ncbi:MAG: hypothetical protein US30_C0001G0100 [Candidatus Moranbacteria bacterium GW2011_GWF2_36_839]|nr:MAG: hypothetical protein US27_C0001G0100 [Candidatus Moranbacteria bacterium GW2011_GWF1_36_78]KKQ17766.1 MAG: hypothetical protein US30_C0001G0100 [Candidatus Moranbacteria bacterium GW2011_GWF2_36_839]
MEFENMLKLAKKYLTTAILAGLFLGAISFLVLIVTQKSFRSNTDILIVQNQEGAVDYYAMSRSADYLSSILSESVYSEKFLDETIATGKISTNLFSGSQADKLKAWQKTINIKKNSTVGILSLEIFGNTERQTNDISNGVLDVLINKNSMFLGTNQNLKIQVLSGPIIEKNPSFFQIILASLGGFIVGMILIFMFGIYRSQIGNAKDESYLSADSDYWKERLNQK